MKRALLAFLLFGPVVAQTPDSHRTASGRDTITQERVTGIIRYLASDELAGRGTPSPGLEAAATFLAAGFKAAGLDPVCKDKSWFHTYERAGMVADPKGIELAVLNGDRRKALEPGTDFRIYRAFNEYKRDAVEPTVVVERDAGRLRRATPRRPVLIVVSKDSALWKACAGRRSQLTGQRGRVSSRAPILLVREGLLPDQQPAGEEDEEVDTRLQVAIKVPAAAQIQLQLKNVVAVLPGKKRPGEYVLFSAHYDHLGTAPGRGGDSIYNGADDDATGTTAVLALAEAYARNQVQPDCSLLFVCFSGEERGFLGSRAFVKDPPVPLGSIRVDLNIEMIGRPLRGNRMAAWVTGKRLSDFEEIVAAAFKRADIRVVDFGPAAMLFRASDNWPLATKGVVAHSISAGSLHSDYHQPSDEIDKLDLEHMTAVIRGLYEAGLEFANREQPPKYNERGRRQLRLGK
jgi:Peptidase family M28